jgi:hypothetical protein
MGNDCSKGGGKCKGSYFAADPQSSRWGAKFCADEGGKCKAVGGPATVYYGGALSWRKIRLNKGQEVECTRSGWKEDPGQECGCNPAPALKKYCFKVQEFDPNQEFCCGGNWVITPNIGPSYDGRVDSFRGDNLGEVKGKIRSVVTKQLAGKEDLAKFAGVTVDSATEDIYGQVCKPCAVSSAQTGYLGLDMESWPAATELGTSTAIDMAMLVPLVQFLVVLNCVVLLYVFIRKCIQCGKCIGKRKKYQVVQSEYDVEKRAYAPDDV